MTFTAVLGLPLRLIRRNPGHHHATWHDAPDEKFADTDIRALHGLPAPERLPLTPLPAPVTRYYVPHAVPDVPSTCWCGRPAAHLHEALESGTAEDIDREFSTAQFPAVTP